MTKKRKLLEKLLSGTRNVQFDDMVNLVGIWFSPFQDQREPHIFEHPSIPELVNLQNKKGQAKPYQVRQFLLLVEQYNLTLEDSGDSK